MHGSSFSVDRIHDGNGWNGGFSRNDDDGVLSWSVVGAVGCWWVRGRVGRCGMSGGGRESRSAS